MFSIAIQQFGWQVVDNFSQKLLNKENLIQQKLDILFHSDAKTEKIAAFPLVCIFAKLYLPIVHHFGNS